MPEPVDVAAVLASTRSVAVVGVSPRPDRASNEVACYLIDHTDYDVYLVNPTDAGTKIHGLAVYGALGELPVVPDLVDVFRRAEHLPAVAADAVAVGAKTFWAQFGLHSDEAATIAGAGGLTVVQDRCLMVDHLNLHP